MAKYRKKPVEIEAFEWTGDRHQIEDPIWISDAIKEGAVQFDHIGTGDVQLTIKTLEGNMRANRGDYIIKGVQGEIYPCKPDIFEQTYEKVDQ
ncbi:hypothetical protein ACS127_17255 [Amphibacillus sp. Q70]|uniref:hypothetical protein n=1 Tax=Amphibacillus sp. Q70 TaxID=3453416 RepID=UPI003F85D3F2